MYSQSYEKEIIGYEVFVIKSQNECEVKMGGVDVKLEAKELFASAGDFGKTAWSFKELNKAEDKFNFLCGEIRKEADPLDNWFDN